MVSVLFSNSECFSVLSTTSVAKERNHISRIKCKIILKLFYPIFVCMQIPSFYKKFDKVYKNLSEIKKENDNSQII